MPNNFNYEESIRKLGESLKNNKRMQEVLERHKKWKKTRPKFFLDDVEWNWKWPKDEKERARAVFVCGIIEYSEWLKIDPELPPSLKRIKHANGLYGVEIINDR